MTWRAPTDLLERVRSAAARGGRSMNEYVTLVLAAATDPDLEGSEAGRLREELAQAGLLATGGPVRQRPDAGAVQRARQAAGRGTPLADIVTRDRS